MATNLSALLRTPSLDAQDPEFLRRLTQAVGFQVPDRDDLKAALPHGAGAVRVLLAAPKLNDALRRDLASEGLLEWSKNVLTYRDGLNVAQALVSAGADVNVAEAGRTPICAFAEQLGRVEAQEDALRKTKPATLETGGTKALRAAWALLEANGANTRVAQGLRQSAYQSHSPQPALSVEDWRKNRTAPSPSESPSLSRALKP